MSFVLLAGIAERRPSAMPPCPFGHGSVPDRAAAFAEERRRGIVGSGGATTGGNWMRVHQTGGSGRDLGHPRGPAPVLKPRPPSSVNTLTVQNVGALQRSIGNHLLSQLLSERKPDGSPQVQRSTIGDHSDPTKWQNDSAKISNATLMATDEFIWLDGLFGSGWTSTPIASFTEAQLLLGLRLILRDVHARSLTIPTGKDAFINFARSYLDRAVLQAGAAEQSEQLAGKTKWTGLGPPDFTTPKTSLSDFTRWLLVPKQPAPTDTSSMNCWELVMYSGFRGGYTTKSHLQTIYKAAAGTTGMGPPREIEKRLCGSRQTLDLSDPHSPEPVVGDIVIFNEFAGHAAISLGTKTAGGAHEVMSLWTVPPTSGGKAVRTTIEVLAGATHLAKVDFCSPKWQ